MQKFTKDELKKRLSALQYCVTQENATEPPFNNQYYQNKDKGDYNCVVCGKLLFKSSSKFDSGSGWPAFWSAYDPTQLKETKDQSHGMIRVEVRCNNCNAHLGHKFDDGPVQYGGIRYCINSASLAFQKQQ